VLALLVDGAVVSDNVELRFWIKKKAETAKAQFLHKRESNMPRITCGLSTNHVADINAMLNKALEMKYDFIVVPLFHPRSRRDASNVSDSRSGPITRSDLVMESRTWTTCIVGKISPWMNLDSPCEHIRDSSEKALKQELAWAVHLSVPAVLLPTPSFDCANFAHVINQFALSAQYLELWIRIPVCSTETMLSGLEEIDDAGAEKSMDTSGSNSGSGAAGSTGNDDGVVDDDESASRDDTWKIWNRIRCMCEYHPRIFAALELTADLPSSSQLERWMGEPVKAIIIPTSVFITNKKGYPTLSQRHQRFLSSMFQFKVRLLVEGRSRRPVAVPMPGEAGAAAMKATPPPPPPRDGVAEGEDKGEGEGGSDSSSSRWGNSNSGGSPGGEFGGMLVYLQYLSHLIGKIPTQSQEERFISPYNDFLQAPLQPLMDNLESQTYETFEKDPVKYVNYRLAVQVALEKTPVDKVSVVMVVGAGRGPLVRAALQAATDAQRKVRVYAVEKNPNAVVTLRSIREAEGWGDAVQIISGDMRHWNPPASEYADVMVSELLGSFGDNELSPECLDGAQK
jgi:protein arginine N-methyltransferase 5